MKTTQTVRQLVELANYFQKRIDSATKVLDAEYYMGVVDGIWKAHALLTGTSLPKLKE